MNTQFVKLYAENPEQKKIEQIAAILGNGGLVIYPTDTVYGLGCDITKAKSIEAIASLKGIKPEKANFSIICYDLSQIAMYAKVSTVVYKVMKKALPGPFTFILPASSQLPKSLSNKKKSIGIRIPDLSIPRLLVKELGNPIITTSIHDEDDIIEYATDPELIFEKFQNKVDVVIDGGYGNVVASTIVDCTNDEFTIVRQGLGDLDAFL